MKFEKNFRRSLVNFAIKEAVNYGRHMAYVFSLVLLPTERFYFCPFHPFLLITLKPQRSSPVTSCPACKRANDEIIGVLEYGCNWNF